KAREPLPVRLQEIYDGVSELIRTHRPDTLAVEDVFYAHNVRTTIVLGHARGVILLAGQQAGIEIVEYPPAEIKRPSSETAPQPRHRCSSCLHACCDSSPCPRHPMQRMALL